MLREVRRQQLLEIIATRGAASVSELAEKLSVSKSTVRHDLHHLEEVGAVRVTRGGAILRSGDPGLSTVKDPTYDERLIRFQDAKRRIGEKVGELLSKDDGSHRFLMLDDGSTNLMVARSLSRSATNTPGVTVVTNGLSIASELAKNPSNNTIVCGGNVEYGDDCVLGPLAEDTIRRFRGEVAIIGATGLAVDFGVTTVSLTKRELKRAMIQSCDVTIVVADGSKIGRIGPIKVCGLEEIDYLVTDSSAPAGALEEIQRKYPKLNVVVA